MNLNSNQTKSIETITQLNSRFCLKNNLYSGSLDSDRNQSRVNHWQTQTIALADCVGQMERNGCSLYHLTLTYKPYGLREYRESDVSQFFKNFYMAGFLPFLLQTNKFNRPNKRPLQPVCFAFVDEHENNPRVEWKHVGDGEIKASGQFAERLHHHAIIVAKPETVDRLNSMLGENTFATNYFSPKIMTSCLQQANIGVVPYAAKMMWKYPEYLLFSGGVQ